MNIKQLLAFLLLASGLTILGSGEPSSISFTPNGKIASVTGPEGSHIYKVDTKTGKLTLMEKPGSVQYTPDLKFATISGPNGTHTYKVDADGEFTLIKDKDASDKK